MDQLNTKAKITTTFQNYFSRYEKSLDHVSGTSETPAASEPSSVYKNPASAGLEENNIEQAIEQNTSQGNEERQSISNKPNQPRNIIFPLRHFGKQKRAFNLKWFNQFKFLHYREDSYSVICHTCAKGNEEKLRHLKERTHLLQLVLLTGKKLMKNFKFTQLL